MSLPDISPDETGAHKAQKQQIYGGIIKSTAVLGTFRVFTVILNFARYKIVALTLGPAGVGIFGLFDVFVTTAVTASSLGVNVSAVRQIAVANSSKDRLLLTDSIRSLRILTQTLALIGACVVAIFSGPISRLTFDSPGFERPMLITAIAVYFTTLACGYRAQLQGLNRIKDLAWIGGGVAVADAIVVTIPIAIWGQQAIAPAIAASALIGAWLFWRSCPAPKQPEDSNLSPSRFWAIAMPFITMGISIAAALLLSNLVIYGTRVLVNQSLGLAEAGLYFAAFTLSGKTVSFLLDAMRNDFYPRLSAVAGDNAQLNALINGQTEICLLLTVPSILATIAFAPYLMEVFFSASFTSGAPYVALFALGSLARVISTPFGYVRLAKGRSLVYLLTSAISAIIQIALVYALLMWQGVMGAVVAYVVHAFGQTILLVYTARRLSNFEWSTECARLALVLTASVIVIFILAMTASVILTAMIGGGATVLIGCFNARELSKRLGPQHRITKLIRRAPLIGKLVT